MIELETVTVIDENNNPHIVGDIPCQLDESGIPDYPEDITRFFYCPIGMECQLERYGKSGRAMYKVQNMEINTNTELEYRTYTN